MNKNKPVILAADDEPFYLQIIAETLAESGYELAMAGSGEQAWAMLQADPQRYSAVILDRMMPEVDGIEVLRRIKRDRVLKALPVIIQTGLAAPEQIAEALRAGAFYYLVKPLNPTVLRAVVATAIRDRDEYFVGKQDAADKLKACDYLQDATLAFRTDAEARQIAILLSSFCAASEIAMMGLTELMLNAVEHGNLGITYEEKTSLIDQGRLREEVTRRLALPEFSDKTATVRFRRLGNRLVFNITDQGKGFEWPRYLEMSPERLMHNHGRGIAMSHNIVFSSLTYHAPGNSVEAVIEQP